MDAQTLLEDARRIGDERRKGAESYKGPPLRFTHLGNDREADMPWLSHEAMAGRVRMLMRTDLDHESVVCAARDRILHLAQENERLRGAEESERAEREKLDRLLRAKDEAMGVLFERLSRAGVDCSDLTS